MGHTCKANYSINRRARRFRHLFNAMKRHLVVAIDRDEASLNQTCRELHDAGLIPLGFRFEDDAVRVLARFEVTAVLIGGVPEHERTAFVRAIRVAWRSMPVISIQPLGNVPVDVIAAASLGQAVLVLRKLLLDQAAMAQSA